MTFFNPGCRSDYKVECHADTSDLFVCPASACQIGSDHYQARYSEWFPCRNGKYCIWKGLVCDGHAQCEDKSGKDTSSISNDYC